MQKKKTFRKVFFSRNNVFSLQIAKFRLKIFFVYFLKGLRVCESAQLMIYACGSLLSTQSEIRQTYCRRPGTITIHKGRMLGGKGRGSFGFYASIGPKIQTQTWTLVRKGPPPKPKSI